MGAINSLGSSLFENVVPNAQQAAGSKGLENIQELGKSEFLKLLVAQLQNQDPMNPIDNNEFVTQLASFSSLEQLIAINQAVTKIAESH